MIIGITGGVGAGKSTVLEYLKNKHNAYVIEADKVAHELMLPGFACYDKIIQEFGTTDRKILGEITFKDPDKLKTLSDIIHPEVRKEIERNVKKIQAVDPDKLIVIEAALLIEAGYESLCDQMWCITTDYETRKKRLMESRGYSLQKIDEIIANQLSDNEFKKHCDYSIENSENLSETYAQIEKILEF